MAFQITMLQFVCDYCANIKEPAETWINGMAAENVGTQAARREVIIDPAWRYERAVQPLAVHFCSIDCKDSYLAELFDKPASLLEVKSVKHAPATGTRIVRARKKPITGPVQKR
ncbi:MAG: hypothetical protein WBW69_09435 [Candidatus Korobacteraceae bacterium]